ncbi:MAG: hypothetical protein FWB91_13245, partial [Defluviitaleaceae bacterium]|nr:hypothetical protein [Defluviitaleaceae bacterium]
AISIENGEVERKPRLRRRRFCAMTEPILDGIVYSTSDEGKCHRLACKARRAQALAKPTESLRVER